MFALLLPGKLSVASFLQLVARLRAPTCGSRSTPSDIDLYCASVCARLCHFVFAWPRGGTFYLKDARTTLQCGRVQRATKYSRGGGGGPRTPFLHSLSASPGCQIVNRGGRKRSLNYLMQVVITRLFRSVSKVSLPKSELPECCFVSPCHEGWYWLMS